MTKYEPGHKEATREKIVTTASRMFRERGVRATTVPDVMEAAGLTVGGFYKHFESKEDLFCAAFDEALASTKRSNDKARGEVSNEEWRRRTAERYLSEFHRDHPEAGCAFAALCGDLQRAEPEIRQQVQNGLVGLIGGFETHMSGSGPEAREAAWRFLAQMLGGLVLSRSVADANTSTEILEACRGMDRPPSSASEIKA